MCKGCKVKRVDMDVEMAHIKCIYKNGVRKNDWMLRQYVYVV